MLETNEPKGASPSSSSSPGGWNLLVPQPLAHDNPATAMPHIPSVSVAAVLAESTSMPDGTPQCRGYDFGGGGGGDRQGGVAAVAPSGIGQQPKTDHFQGIVDAWLTTGFQATNLGLAVTQINELRAWRLSDVPYQVGVDDPALQSDTIRRQIRARIFFAYTSNQISSGQRETIRFLVQNKMVDVIVTTAGGIEEDIIKCFQPTFMGDFTLSGKELRKKGINRIGNLLVPNKNYCVFEDWMDPLIHKMHDEQDAALTQWAEQQQQAAMRASTRQVESGGSRRRPNQTTELEPLDFVWTPSKIIHRLGLEVNHPDSVLYWAAVNNIPVFCPALTDGSIGDMFYFHSYKRPGFILDTNLDIRRLNDLAVRSHCTGQIILGGGVVKHHTCNANLMRNGADYSVFINTAGDYDGSDSGASPDEAISWGKIRINAHPVKVTADATLVFPLLVAATFAKDVDQWMAATQDCVCWVDDLPSSEDA